MADGIDLSVFGYYNAITKSNSLQLKYQFLMSFKDTVFGNTRK